MLYYDYMINGTEKLGVFTVPTGIGASIGGYAGDASAYARKFSDAAKLIVNPNVVNAGGFSGINGNMLYVEGFVLDEFMKGHVNLIPTQENKVGIVFDKAIPADVLNIHINTMNAIRIVYGIDVEEYVITDEPAGVEFILDEATGISYGSVKTPKTLLRASKILLERGCTAIAVVCLFDDPEELNKGYVNGTGTDPAGGVEAIISHYISASLRVPCAHAPAFNDCQIYPDLVNPKSASEYITPTFLPCILLGLAQAPSLAQSGGISVKDVDFAVMPYSSMGSPAILAAVEHRIKVYAVKENLTALDITPEKLGIIDSVSVAETYQECLNYITLDQKEKL